MTATKQLSVRIDEHGLIIASPPPVLRRLFQLDGRTTLTPRDGRGTVITTQPSHLYVRLDGHAIRLPAGAWRLLNHATTSLGFELSVQVASDVRLPWEQADDVIVDSVAEYVASRSFGVICYPTDKACVEVAARIVNGLPNENIGFVTSSIAQATRLRVDLQERGIQAIDPRGGQIHGVLVGVDGSFRDPSWLGVVVTVNVGKQLGDRETRVYRHAWRAKRLALVDDRLPLTKTERSRILMRYGFEWQRSLRDGSLARPVEIAAIKANRSDQDMPNLQGVECERRLIWWNSARNRRIASWAERNRRLRPVLVSGSIEHAAELAAQLPAWQIVVGEEPNLTGLAHRHVDTLRQRCTTVHTGPAIVTTEGLPKVDWRDVDVVVRGDGTSGLLNLPEAALAATERRLPLTIVDVDDSQIHPALAKRHRDRRRAYRQAEWYPRGVDPAVARMETYLRERAQ